MPEDLNQNAMVSDALVVHPALCSVHEGHKRQGDIYLMVAYNILSYIGVSPSKRDVTCNDFTK